MDAAVGLSQLAERPTPLHRSMSVVVCRWSKAPSLAPPDDLRMWFYGYLDPVNERPSPWHQRDAVLPPNPNPTETL